MDKVIVIKGACPAMRQFIQHWRYDLEGRPECERLMASALALLGNSRATPEVECARAWMSLDWLAREIVPAFLDLTPGLAAHAHALRALPPVDGPEPASRAKTALDAAKRATAAEGAGGSEEDGRAAGQTVLHCAMNAAGHSINFSTGNNAWSAATHAALHAAWQAAKAAAGHAGDSALPWATARAQEGAIDLLTRMSALGAGGPISEDASLFLNCSLDAATKMSESEKTAVLERTALSETIPATAPKHRAPARL